MTKPYDLTALGAAVVTAAKANGLEVADHALDVLATSVYQATKQWVKDSAAMSPSFVNDLIVKYVDDLDGYVLPQIAKLEKLGT